MMDLPADMAPMPDTPIMHCVQFAARHYEIHPDIIRAVLRQECGRDGKFRTNKNKSRDLSHMQINTVHLKELRKYGITETDLLNNACLNIVVGGYRLKTEIVSAPNMWTGIGNYHFNYKVSPSRNREYQEKIWAHVQDIRSQHPSRCEAS